jgi:hypothetical protein
MGAERHRNLRTRSRGSNDRLQSRLRRLRSRSAMSAKTSIRDIDSVVTAFRLGSKLAVLIGLGPKARKGQAGP